MADAPQHATISDDGPAKTVVTGGAGFIGSHLTDRLLELGYQVTVLDDLSTGRAENIAHLEGHPRFRFVQGSILDKELLKSLFEGVTYVFHEAAIPSVPRSIAAPEATHEVNATGTLNVLIAARDAGVEEAGVRIKFIGLRRHPHPAQDGGHAAPGHCPPMR